MTDEQESAINNLRSGNLELSTLVKQAVQAGAKKAVELIEEAETSVDLLNNMKVLETATKIVGLSPKESQTTVQINAINGFDFVQIDDDDIKQITSEEEFEEADIEDEDEL